MATMRLLKQNTIAFPIAKLFSAISLIAYFIVASNWEGVGMGQVLVFYMFIILFYDKGTSALNSEDYYRFEKYTLAIIILHLILPFSIPYDHTFTRTINIVTTFVLFYEILNNPIANKTSKIRYKRSPKKDYWKKQV